MKFSDTLQKILNVLSIIFVVLLAVIPVAEIFARLFTGSGLSGTTSYLKHVVVWIAFLGGIITTRNDEHLCLVPEKEDDSFINKIVGFVKSIGGSAFSFSYFLASLSFVLMAFIDEDKVGVLPAKLVVAIIPLGFLIMTFGFHLKRSRKEMIRQLIISILLGTILSIPVIVNLVSNFFPEAPFWIYSVSDAYYQVFSIIQWPMVILIIVMAFFGLPIYLLLGGLAWVLFSGNWGALEVLPNEAYNLLSDNMIAAIPLFTFCGYLLSESDSGTRLVRFFRAALGWMPGGLAIVTVLVCAFFTTFTGASGVTVVALGGLLFVVLSESGHYSKGFSQGLITSSGSIGLLLPPSLPIILYGVTAHVSIKDMFLGGIIPGVILIIALSLMGVIQAVKQKTEKIPFVFKEALSAFVESLGEIMLPVVILVFYFSGITTLVETGAVAVVYTLILLGPIRRELNRKVLSRVISRSMSVLGGILMILAMAKGLSYFLIDASIPQMLTEFFRTNVQSPFVFLILLNLVLLVAGCIMDIYSAILVVAPLIIPLGTLYGIHPVQLGIIFLANLQLGYLTPPVGLNLFLASYTFKTPLVTIYKRVLPFFFVLLIMVLVITYVPWISTALLGN